MQMDPPVSVDISTKMITKSQLRIVIKSLKNGIKRDQMKE